MKQNIEKKYLNYDFLVIGSGLAGLTTGLYLAKNHKVAIVTKRKITDSNTKYAQGGIACVVNKEDSFNDHIKDTISAGAGLCNGKIVKKIIEAGPEAINDLINLGMTFTTRAEVGELENGEDFDLGKEGGHTKRRVLHSGDITGDEIIKTLSIACKKHKNITIFENHIAIDLIGTKHIENEQNGSVQGAYVLNIDKHKIETFVATNTILATGGSGKVYLYTSNPDLACGGGIAMGYRIGANIKNMEFFQFHPTILFHPEVKSFLISEAVRGEGAVLKRYNKNGELIEFMNKYHKMKSLAPRDIVARAIDNEMKISGEKCVYLDIRHKNETFLKKRFPNIFKECLNYGIDMSKDLIPVVPAAHYSCGGIQTDINGFTGINGLYAVGEVASTGFHGANRLASNSLLEAIVIAKFATKDILKRLCEIREIQLDKAIRSWTCGDATNSDELVVITHNWDEIRHFMWDYVGIMRTNKRLERAKTRIKNIRNEIEKYYWDFIVTSDLIELRNIASVAEIIIDAALKRKNSVGLHFNSDYKNGK